MKKKLTIHWFRRDLRLINNPSLTAAITYGKILPIFIFDTYNSPDYQIGNAGSAWLYYSLTALQKTLNNNLYFFRGNPKEIIAALVVKYNVDYLHWNRCYEPWQIERDKIIKKEFRKQNIIIRTFNASLLCEPWTILKKDYTPYKVFTSFYHRVCLADKNIEITLLNKSKIANSAVLVEENQCIENLGLLSISYKKIRKYWNVGEQAAKEKLSIFIEEKLDDYSNNRDYPYKKSVSLLSPHLHWGEISPSYIWYKITTTNNYFDTSDFLREMIWREFSYYLLYHFPHIIKDNAQVKFNAFPWVENEVFLRMWQNGLTGYPIVDAGMRQLYIEGYIHNRVRMIVSSFLVKNLMIHWRYGAQWFSKFLVDADLASNIVSWQWIAGCGITACPYFRIFNPIKQSIKFDSLGVYIKKYIPELNNLSLEYLFTPWTTPKNILHSSGVELGINYPFPIVDLQNSRNKSLKAYSNIKFTNES